MSKRSAKLLLRLDELGVLIHKNIILIIVVLFIMIVIVAVINSMRCRLNRSN